VTARVAVVAAGDELLLGDVVNHNLAWLGETFASAGLEVVRGYEVRDDVDDLVAVLLDACSVAEAVVVTGGLGPTSDDRTREALAALTGVALRTDPVLVDGLRAWFAGRGRPMPATALVQAQLPEGGRSMRNRLGSAPGVVVDVDGRPVYALPGVPMEMEPMVADVVVPELRRLAGDPPALHTVQLRVAVLGESTVAARLAGVERDLPPGVRMAYLGRPGEVRVRFTGTDPTQLDRVRDGAARTLGDVVSGVDDETLAATVVRVLREIGSTVAVAESLTGGALAAAIVDVPGASAVLRGALVAYATSVKTDLLGVPVELVAAVGAVHPDVAVAMAGGVRARLGADWGVATTGVAGPDPQDGVPPGTAYVAVVGPDELADAAHVGAGGDGVAVEVRVNAGRPVVRALTVVHALDLLRRRLLGLPPEPSHDPGPEQRA